MYACEYGKQRLHGLIIWLFMMVMLVIIPWYGMQLFM